MILLKVMALDQSINHTGFAILNDKKELIDYGVINTLKYKDNNKKVRVIYDTINELIQKHKPDCIVIEDTYLLTKSGLRGISAKTNVATLKALNQVRGVLMLISDQLNMPLYVYTTVETRKLITGSGKTTKEDLRKIISEQYSNDFTNDMSDAIALALAHITSLVSDNSGGKNAKKKAKGR